MKIAQINAVYGYSSTGRMIKEFDETFATHGVECVSYTTMTNTDKDTVHIVGSPWDYKLHALCSRVFGTQGYFSRCATRKLLKELRRERPDIVHLHNLHANYLHIPMLLRYLAENDIATVVTLHDCFFFTGKCTHYLAQGCNRWQTGCHHCPRLREDNVSWFFDRTNRLWHHKKQLFFAIPRLAVIGVSDWITGQAQQSLLRTAGMLKRIYNGIDLACFRPIETMQARRALGLGDGFKVLGVAQQWWSSKGLDTVLETARRMPDVEFLLIGDLLDVDPADLPVNVVAVGTTDSPETLANYYAAADAFLNTSLYETFGKTTAEAMACGTPVIGNNTTATPELIEQGCGYLIDPANDVEAICRAIGVIRQNGKDCYTQACRQAALRFDKEDGIRAYLEVYRQLLQNGCQKR